MKHMTRGAVAARAGVHAETVRYYEKRGLLPKPSRTASGYRIYAEDDVARIRFIKRAQELGFTLEEIRELLSLRVDPGTDRRAVRRHAAAKLADLEAKIRDLERMRQALSSLVTACDGCGPTSDCPILEAMQSDDALPVVPVEIGMCAGTGQSFFCPYPCSSAGVCRILSYIRDKR